MLCGRELKFARTLLTDLGRPDLLPLAEAAAGPAQAPLRAFLAQTFALRSQAEWTQWFHGRDVAFAPVRDLRDGLARSGLIVTDADGGHHIAPAIRFAGEPAWQPGPTPHQG